MLSQFTKSISSRLCRTRRPGQRWHAPRWTQSVVHTADRRLIGWMLGCTLYHRLPCVSRAQARAERVKGELPPLPGRETAGDIIFPL